MAQPSVQGFQIDFDSIGTIDSVIAWTKQQISPPTTLTDGSTINWDLDSAPNATVTLGGSRTLNNPTNMRAGSVVTLSVQQDATGNRGLAYGSAFDFGDAGAPTLTNTPNKYDVLTFMVVSTSKLRFLSIAQGFSN